MGTATFNALPMECIKPVYGVGLGGADAFAGTVTSDVVNLANYAQPFWLVRYDGTGSTGTATITVEACSNAAASATAAIEFYYQLTPDSTNVAGTLTKATSAGFTIPATTKGVYLVSADVSAVLAQGYQYVRLKSVEVVNDPVAGGIMGFLANPEYASKALPAAIT